MAASSDNDQKQGWMGIRKFNAKNDEYMEADEETGERVVDVRSKQLEELFTADEWATLGTHHNIKTLNRERLVYHWLSLKPPGKPVDQTVVKERKELLLSLWDNKIFHPFVDMDGAHDIINEKKCNTWVLRLSTTEPGKLTISYPSVKSDGGKEVNHVRIHRTDSKFSLWGNQYNSIEEVIVTMTDKVTASFGTIDGGQNIEPEIYKNN